MKKKGWLHSVGLLVAIGFAVAIGQPARAQNDLLNSGFEEGTGTDADFWTEGIQHYRSSEWAHMGTYSLKSEYLGTGTHTLTTASISVVPGTYYVSYWAWRDSSAGTALLQIDYYFGADPTFATTTTTGAWQYVSGSWTVDTADEVYIWLVTENMTAGVYFDDVCFSTIQASCAQNTATPTRTSTPSHTGTRTKTPTVSQTPTNTRTPTQTNTPNSSATPTFTPTVTFTKTPLSTFVWADGPVEVDADLLVDLENLLVIDPPDGINGYVFAITDVSGGDGTWNLSVVNIVGIDTPFTDWTFDQNAGWSDSVTCSGIDPDYSCEYFVSPLVSGAGSSGLIFPFKPGTRAIYGLGSYGPCEIGRGIPSGRGIHCGISYIPGSLAVDFVGTDGGGSSIMPPQAYASESGTVTFVCRGTINMGVKVEGVHQLYYLHLAPNTQLGVGDTVTAGQMLGLLVHGGFNDPPCGVASQSTTSYHLHFAFVCSNSYLQIGGCNLNCSTGMWVCGSTAIGPNGTLGGGSYPGPDPDPGPSPVLGGEHIWDGILVGIGTFIQNSIRQWLPGQDPTIPLLIDDGRLILQIVMLVLNVYIFGPNSFTTNLMLVVITLVISLEITYWVMDKLLDAGQGMLNIWKQVKTILLPFL